MPLLASMTMPSDSMRPSFARGASARSVACGGAPERGEALRERLAGGGLTADVGVLEGGGARAQAQQFAAAVAAHADDADLHDRNRISRVGPWPTVRVGRGPPYAANAIRPGPGGAPAAR